MDRTITIKNKRSNTSHLKLSKMFDSKTLIFMIIGFLLSRSILIDGIAPLGLALYWLISNILIIIERLIIDKIYKIKEEKENA